MTAPKKLEPDQPFARPPLPVSKRLAIGDRVRLSEDGREHYPGLAFDKVDGTVTGFTRKPGYVRLKLDTAQQSRQFHERDWERLTLPADHAYLSAGDTPAASGDRPYTGCFLCGRSRSEHP